MAKSLRHILTGQSPAETRAEIQNEIRLAREAQRTAQAHGQHRHADTARQAIDNGLDELNQYNSGR